MIDCWLQGEPLDPAAFDGALPVMDKDAVLARQASYSRIEPLCAPETHTLVPGEFYPDEETMTEEEALKAASRCGSGWRTHGMSNCPKASACRSGVTSSALRWRC